MNIDIMLIIKIGHRFSGQEVEIPTSQVERISYDASTVFVGMTKAAVEQNLALGLALDGAADSRLI